MDKEKFEKMAEWIKGCCKDEEGVTNCCAMMRKMMRYGEGKEAGKKKTDAGEKE
jgi:hypothetical protein